MKNVVSQEQTPCKNNNRALVVNLPETTMYHNTVPPIPKSTPITASDQWSVDCFEALEISLTLLSVGLLHETLKNIPGDIHLIYIISEETSIFAPQRLPFYMALGAAACTVGKVRASTVFMCVCSTFRSSDFLLFVKNGFVVGARMLNVTAGH